MKDKKIFLRAFGRNEFGFADLPKKLSNITLSRLEYGFNRGCPWCFPHGYETNNATVDKNKRNWKNWRKQQYKSGG